MAGGALGFALTFFSAVVLVAVVALFWGMACHKFGERTTAWGLAKRFKIPAKKYKDSAAYLTALENIRLGEEIQMRRLQEGSALPDFQVMGTFTPNSPQIQLF